MLSQPITCLVERIKDACTQIRIARPFETAGFPFTFAEKLPQSAPLGPVIAARGFPRTPGFFEFARQIQTDGIPIIYEIDDLLLNLPVSHPERKNFSYTDALLPIYHVLSVADGVVVPTQTLKEGLQFINPNIAVVPNYFDDGLWQFRSHQPKTDDLPLEIGFMGSVSHQPDIEPLVPILIRILNRHDGKVKLKFWSMEPPPALRNRQGVEFIPAISYEYREFAAYFQTQLADIFIAPLIDNDFNRCKSAIKFFEYSALGVPGVYADLDPYNGIVTHGYSGLLANTPAEWEENLERLIDDAGLRESIAKNAQLVISQNYLLTKHALEIQSRYQELIAKPESTKAAHPKGEVLTWLACQVSEQGSALANTKRDLARLKRDLSEAERAINSLNTELSEIKRSKIYKLGLRVRSLRMKLAPPNSVQSKLLAKAYRWSSQLVRKKRPPALRSGFLIVDDVKLQGCQASPGHPKVDIIICVHNALEDIKLCISSLLRCTSQPYELILVDDGSDSSTREFLKSISAEHNAKLLRNETAQGYTKAANLGMRNSSSDYFVLLNSDTLLTPQWLDRLFATMLSDPKIAVVGPLSNTASWQSVPELSEGNDWAENPLPENIDLSDYSAWIAKYSACLRPVVPLLNGFCMLVNRQVAEMVGYFDEESFPRGYGEEDDFNLRVSKLGKRLAIADDAFVYHAQSRSYSSARRTEISSQSAITLNRKHGEEVIHNAVSAMHPNRVLAGIRARVSANLDREMKVRSGQKRFQDRAVLFVLPVMDAGGGANVIMDEAAAMQKMGVAVKILNLPEYRETFQANYHHSPIPILYEPIERIPIAAQNYDAIIATAHYSVPWFEQLKEVSVITGYYVQGYEALMYPVGSVEAKIANESYTQVPGMKLFTKTAWTQKTVHEHTGAKLSQVGISINADLFRPRAQRPLSQKPVRVAAMIRADSLYRNPNQTIRILREVKQAVGNDLECLFFGCDEVRNVVNPELLNFDFQQLGKLRQTQVASLMSEIDVFVDFSSHQAMGLTALEAMASGATVIVPLQGGATEFVKDSVNGMVVDTENFSQCVNVLRRLVEDDLFRSNLQMQAIKDVVQYHPEGVAYRILSVLFGDEISE